MSRAIRHKFQQQQGWGVRVIPQLTRDIVDELPEIKGFSERKMKRMLRFHREYAFPPSVDPSPGEHATVKVPQAVALLRWFGEWLCK